MKWLVILSLLLASGPAFAQTSPMPEVDASELPPSAAKRLILELKKQVREEKIAPAVVKRPVTEAIRAAERARGARDAGDGTNGARLDKLAEQWASAGQAVLRAVRAERAAKKTAAELGELTTKVKRAEALLHEQQSRLGRLRADLERLEQKAETDKAAAAGGAKKQVEKSGTKAPPKPRKKQ